MRKYARALWPLASLEKLRVERGHGKSSWGPGLATNRTWQIYASIWGPAAEYHSGVTVGTYFLPISDIAQIAVILGFPCTGMPPKACLCPGYHSALHSGRQFLVLGRRDESESHE